MKFSRKLAKRSGYASITIPKPVLDAWVSVTFVEMMFDEEENILIVCPKLSAIGEITQ
jgi:hypothetical protein